MTKTLPVLIFLSFCFELPAQRLPAKPSNAPTVDGNRHAVTRLNSWLRDSSLQTSLKQNVDNNRNRRATCSYPVYVACGQVMHRLSNISAVTWL